jgi:hypothetical protein
MLRAFFYEMNMNLHTSLRGGTCRRGNPDLYTHRLNQDGLPRLLAGDVWGLGD